MKTGIIVKSSFALSILTTVVGACLKIIHSEGVEVLLIIGLIVSLIFIIAAVYEVRKSKRIGFAEKAIWTIALIFIGGITGIVYMIGGRRRIALNS
jgi:4-hydroxybenzoate polyprenyltransferase